MANMKKIISVIVAVCMFASIVPGLALAAEQTAFTDISGTEYYADAAKALSALGVLSGYQDGSFGADKFITRAEMSAVITRMLDKEDSAEKAVGKTNFDDVDEKHWASGYINIASKEGIINGDGNGKFRPEDDVKYEEAVKMLVCALGLDKDITANPSDWSKPYIALADKNGITKNLKGSKGNASTRGDIAVMVYNALTYDLAAPIASLEAGSYKGTQTVTLTAASDAVIYYTLDGSNPSVKSEKYTKNISVTKTSVLKAVAVRKNVLVSNVLSVEYTITAASSGGGGGGGGSSTKKYTVSFNLNYDGAEGAPKSQSVIQGKYAEYPEEPEREDYVFVGWYTSEDFSEVYNFADTKVTSNIELFARWVDIADTTDTDGDGLTDPVEEFYGTDATLIDTDGDGLSDYVEIVVLGLDPLKTDTDDNGVPDGEEDSDSDSISNLDEISIGTNPSVYDSDGDGLSDGEETNEYLTDPLNKDTDGDGVSDGKEIELGTDPLVAQESFDITLESDVTEDTVKPSVEIILSGEQVETLSITPFENSALFPEDMPGYMGQAYDFNVEGEFESAKISFEFDSSTVEEDSIPTICYFDEENQELIDLDTTIEGNIASATVTHFSTYVLIDRKIYNESLKWEDVWVSDGKFTDVEVVFVIDDSGSMTWNDMYNERLSVAEDLIDKLPENSSIGIVKFENYVDLLTESLITDKEEAKSYLNTGYFYSSGGTYMYAGINDAFSLFESDEESVLKLEIVLTDGDSFDLSRHSSTISEAISNNVRIYTVGLGSSTSYFYNYLQPLAEETGGAFYLAANAEDLAAIYADISKKIDIETDSDNDGIPDYYEDNMIAFNGKKIELDKNNPDTDGDGLLDGEEIIVEYIYNADRSQIVVKGKMLSDPTKVDSDEDGITDNDDTAPLAKGLADGVVGELCLLSCGESNIFTVSINLGAGSGHSFLVYKSYVNDDLDMSSFNRGWATSTSSWADATELDAPGTYSVGANEAVSMGAGGFYLDDAVCAAYNLEFYKRFNLGYTYSPNAYLKQTITEEQLSKVLNAFAIQASKNYNFLLNNCTHVSLNVWNEVFGTKYDPIGINTPKGLKELIEKQDNSYSNYSLDTIIQ